MSFGKSTSPHLRRGRLPSALRAEASASPILDRLLRLVEGACKDATVHPRARYLLLCRQQTFGAIRETSRGVVLGLYLPGTLVGDRLMDGAGFRLNRVSHQVVLRSVEDVDDELRVWLRRAYDRG